MNLFGQKKIRPACFTPIQESISEELKEALKSESFCLFYIDNEGDLVIKKGKLKFLEKISYEFVNSKLVKELRTYNKIFYIHVKCEAGKYYIELTAN